MQLRRLEPSDAAVYRAVRLRGLRDHPEAFTSSFEEENQRSPGTESARLSSGSPAVMWGAFAGAESGEAAEGAESAKAARPGGELIGVFGFIREQRLKNCHKASLVGMLVAPGFTGRGIGRALVQAVVQEARAEGMALLVLTVTEGNAAARALYARAGFKTFGIEPDAIRVAGTSFCKEHMALQLTPPLRSYTPDSAPESANP